MITAGALQIEEKIVKRVFSVQRVTGSDKPVWYWEAYIPLITERRMS